MRAYVSYATEYDVYKGHKDWSELTIEQQDDIIRAELRADADPETLIIRYDLIKKQAQGIRRLFIYISMTLEKAGRIKDTAEWSESQRNQIIAFLEGTALGKRLSETFHSPSSEKRQFVDGKDLALFTETDFDYVIDLPLSMAKLELLRGLRMETPDDETIDLPPAALISRAEFIPAKKEKLWNFLPVFFGWPKELLNTLNALESLYDAYKSDDVYHNIAVNDVFTLSKKIIKAHKAGITESIRVHKHDPIEIVLMTIWNISSKAISTGQHHIYRGILTDLGKGYLSVFLRTMNLLLEMGFIDKGEVDKNLRAIQKTIKCAG